MLNKFTVISFHFIFCVGEKGERSHAYTLHINLNGSVESPWSERCDDRLRFYALAGRTMNKFNNKIIIVWDSDLCALIQIYMAKYCIIDIIINYEREAPEGWPAPNANV